MYNPPGITDRMYMHLHRLCQWRGWRRPSQGRQGNSALSGGRGTALPGAVAAADMDTYTTGDLLTRTHIPGIASHAVFLGLCFFSKGPLVCLVPGAPLAAPIAILLFSVPSASRLHRSLDPRIRNLTVVAVVGAAVGGAP